MGICVPHAGFRYFVGLSAELERLAAQDGFDVLHVFSQSDGEAELRRVQLLANYRIDGLLLLPSPTPQAALDWLADARMPTVILDRPIDDRRFNQVTVDTRAAMEKAGRRLIELGHCRLLFVTSNQRLLISQRRLEGLRQAMRGCGRKVTLRIMERRIDREEDFFQQLAEVMRGTEPPTAIIGTNTMAIGWIVTAMRRLALAVPDQVSILAADEPEWSTLVQPPLAALHAPTRVIARNAWTLLREVMTDQSERPRRIAIEPELRAAASIGPAPSPA